MKKFTLFHQWLLSLCFMLVTLPGLAAEVIIEGYEPVGTYDGSPLYEITEPSIIISSTAGSVSYVYVDGNLEVICPNLFSTYNFTVSAFFDDSIHELQLKKWDSDYGICYFYIRFEENDGLFYSISEEQAIVAGVKDGIITAEIPSSIEKDGISYPVTSIGNSAFSGCSGLTSLTIPNSVTSIANGAFKGCTGITLFDIPNSITTIGSEAFSGCTGLSSLEIPNSVTSIGSSAFGGCSGLNEIIISDGSESIGFGSHVFSGVEMTKLYLGRNFTYNDYIYGAPFYTKITLKELAIGNSVTSIGSSAFRGCSGLCSVEIPNSVAFIRSEAFSGCSGLNEIIISDGNGSIEFGSSVFEGVEMTKFYLGRNFTGYSPFSGKSTLPELTIGNSVTSIANGAFKGCTGITLFDIPNSITTIGSEAFSGCTGLSSLEIPNSVTFIGDNAFSGCSGLNKIMISDGSESIKFSEYAFEGVEISKFYLGRNFTGYSPFSGKSTLPELTIGNSVTSIAYGAFKGCTGITSLEIPNSITTIGSEAFRGCTRLSSLEMPNSVTSIGSYAFSGCTGLTTVEIPNSVASIGSYAFSGCTGLTTVEIPNSVASIGSYAFSGCSRLYKLIISDGSESIEFGDYAFEGVKMTKLYLGRNFIYNSFFSTSAPFRASTTLRELIIGNSVTSIGDFAFSNCTGLKEITLLDGSESIAFGSKVFDEVEMTKLYLGRNFTFSRHDFEAPFYKKSTLRELTIGNLVTSIVNDAFNGCSGLDSVEIPNSVTSIGSYAFSGCSGLIISVEIPNSVTSIGSYAFSGCSGLIISVEIPNSVTSIGSYAFSGCWSLIRMEIPNSVKTIGNRAFYKCNSLKEITISDGSESIEFGLGVFEGGKMTKLYLGRNFTCSDASVYAPFYKQTTLKELTIGNQVTSIGNRAFRDCSGLTSVEIGTSVTSIGEYAFGGCGSLGAVYCNALNSPSAYGSAFDDKTYRFATLNVPAQSINRYKAHSVWSKFYYIAALTTPVESIELDPSVWKGEVGETFRINATVYPEEATNKELKWSSSDESVATVDEKGKVTVLKSASCDIIARATDGSGVEAICKLDTFTGVVEIEEESAGIIQVFNLNGVLILTSDNKDCLKSLNKGIYIICQGNRRKKIIVN